MRVCINIKKKVRGTIEQLKVKGLYLCFVLNLRMSGENCLIFNWHGSSAAPEISFFRVPTKNGEYSKNWRKVLQLLLVMR